MEEIELSSRDNVMADGDHQVTKRASKEGWYGAVLLASTALFSTILLGGGFWWAYTRIYLDVRQEKASIVRLPSDIPASEATDTETDPAVVPVVTPSAPASGESVTVPADAKQEAVVVLNGGGAKGSAGTIAVLLKQGGYAKVTTGNTTKDYTGVTVYHAAGKGDPAAAIVKILLKQYPKAVSKEAPKTDAEASSSAVVVIIGK